MHLLNSEYTKLLKLGEPHIALEIDKLKNKKLFLNHYFCIFTIYTTIAFESFISNW